MKLLTFLGAPGKYYETTYMWQDQEFTTMFAPAASCRFLKPDEIVVFLTEEAREHSYPDFSQTLPEGVKKTPVDIPVGKETQELWELFELISGQVTEGDTVAFDITHGLRAFPYISLLVAAYLRSGLNVRLEAVVYGAFDVRDETTTLNRAPMFDLSPMIKLLEWSSAADRFKRTGDARYLASLVEEQRDSLAKKANGDHARLQEIGRLGNLAGALESISQSLRLIRPRHAMEQIAGLQERIEWAKPALAYAPAAYPFQLLLDRIGETYIHLGFDDPYASDTLTETLEKERQMLRWYVEREQWPQAVSLAREWLVSWVMNAMSMRQLSSLNDRQRVEWVIGMEASEYLKAKENGGLYQAVFLNQIEDVGQILSLWHRLTETRNDIDHAGMREDPKTPTTLIKQIKSCLSDIEDLPL